MKNCLFATFIAVTTLVGCQHPNVGTTVESPKPDISHNARASLDWNGVYSGIVPCEDCSGTKLWLELKANGQYSMSRSYIDKMSITVMEEGSLVWNTKGNTINVDDYRFFVAENKLFLVDQSGERVLDKNGNSYVLSKDAMK